jgi:hypothetical protein
LQSRTWRSPQDASDTTIFQPLVMRTRSPLLETDLYLHKNNATYISDIDIARWHCIMALFLPAIRSGPNHNSSLSRASSGAPPATDEPTSKDPTTLHRIPRGMLQVILGQVSCNFKREIKPYQPYEIWTRVLTWDDKWMYFVTHFVRADTVPKRGRGLQQPWKAGGKQWGAGERGDAATGKSPRSEQALLASALSQCVFKDGRMTVRPEVVVREAGLFGGGRGGERVWGAEQVELERLRGLKVVEEATAKDAGALHAVFDPEEGVVLGEYKDVWAWVPFLK